AVADDINSGGGINVSQDGNTLYVAETQGEAIRVLRRNPSDGSVETINSIALGTAPDNIDVAADGSLWVGAHSNLFALIMHFIAGTDAPSQILRVELNNATEPTIKEIYMNRGDEISASSIGLTYGKQLLIGSITATKILICEMDGA
ncbi:MAG: beta-propeller fold lactonase family protein, partial [Gammaproteobacteria bacterium]|nr:beta-propeller fold lactonase family protein [Gammaproteobacteria bacterium]